MNDDEQPLLWHQVGAFRELLHEGSALLGEVLVFTRNAEASLAALEREKVALETERLELRTTREEALASLSLERERTRRLEEEVLALSAELESTRAKAGEGEKTGEAVNRLRETLELLRERNTDLELQIATLREPPQPVMVREPEISPRQIAELQAELDRTRQILASERLRRNRAIELIKPRAPQGIPA